MPNNTPSRRTLLADAPAIAAAALAAGTATSGLATALAGDPATDPVFAAIQRHETAMAAHIAAFDDTEDEDAISKTSDAEADALEAALTCRPTTHEGAIALAGAHVRPIRGQHGARICFRGRRGQPPSPGRR
jgi:hypothetical protein